MSNKSAIKLAANLAINEIFLSIQGEGKYTGTPSVFIRLNGCNLRCCFAGGSVCDTPYTSHHPERSAAMDTEALAKKVVEIIGQIGGPKDNHHIVITGGEPMLQQEAILDFFEKLRNNHEHFNRVTIETNGTIIPDDGFTKYNVFWSVSPKLGTSCCFAGTDVPEHMREQHRLKRINIAALAHIAMSGDDYQLKFVYSGPESVDEIKSIISLVKDKIRNDLQASNCTQEIIDIRLNSIDRHIMLMPEGITNEQLTASAPGAVQACIENGWVFCDRAHVRIWGDKRAV